MSPDDLATAGYGVWVVDEGIHDHTIEHATDGTTIAVAGWDSFDPHPAGACRPKHDQRKADEQVARRLGNDRAAAVTKQLL